MPKFAGDRDIHYCHGIPIDNIPGKRLNSLRGLAGRIIDKRQIEAGEMIKRRAEPRSQSPTKFVTSQV